MELDGVHVPLKVTQLMEKGRTYKFLAGLHSEFDHICSMVISRTPFPTLAEAFSAVRTEEMRRKPMPKERIIEASGMTVRKDWKNSAHKLSRQLKCLVCFSEVDCFLQDLTSL